VLDPVCRWVSASQEAQLKIGFAVARARPLIQELHIRIINAATGARPGPPTVR
jgi:hypothetical protein